MFVGWAYFPNGTFCRNVVRDTFTYNESGNRSFKYPVADNHLIWDPVNQLWNASVNANGRVIEAHVQK